MLGDSWLCLHPCGEVGASKLLLLLPLLLLLWLAGQPS
jgi:hypothetical protein